MPQLNRTLGIPMLTFYGTGMILGAGIYSVIGKAGIFSWRIIFIIKRRSICVARPL